MTFPKLLLDLDASSYTSTFGNEILSVTVQNGPSRTRRDFVGAPTIVACQWVLMDIEYEYLMAFYRTSIVMGTLPFLLDMVIDYAPEAEFQCKFVAGSLVLSAVQGDSYTVTAGLEVKPIPANADNDQSVIELFTEYGIGVEPFINELAYFTNVVMPEYLD